MTTEDAKACQDEINEVLNRRGAQLKVVQHIAIMAKEGFSATTATAPQPITSENTSTAVTDEVPVPSEKGNAPYPKEVEFLPDSNA